MTDTPQTATGGCLCGAIRFEAAGEPLWIAHCHCHSCRRNTGAPVTTFVGFPADGFTYAAGRPKVFNSSPDVRRSFCADCGTPLTYEADRAAGEVHVYISTLDNPDAFPPQFHVFTAEGIQWLHLDDNLPRYRATSRDGDAPT